jgi:hypothetical protein
MKPQVGSTKTTRSALRFLSWTVAWQPAGGVRKYIVSGPDTHPPTKTPSYGAHTWKKTPQVSG